jgi:hypothetical protein
VKDYLEMAGLGMNIGHVISVISACRAGLRG